ncbi:consortin, connexin sorting protein b [Megalops cyprinoides]|uniref:consortin, connexin sorting protein b n=1 Tax=Megalops cyprinoides TaxID=118141 RepID=UPI001863F8CC|nr:consortin, connexin sorting protein b [Megalops cyprinoides]XP_036405673.1 consortin, connexin sorting protein b [Megalops cyprinoides]
MDKGGSERGVAEGRGQWGSADLRDNMEHVSIISLRGSDENQNLLPQGRERSASEDSVNNNEEQETDNTFRGHSGAQEPETVSRETVGSPERSPQRTSESGSTGVSESCSSVCPVARPPSLGPSTPGPSPALLASLQELGEHSDHTLLPQSLHQIAEAYFLEEDYEWAVHFIQLERLYHERLLSNLAALQEHWESRWKAAVRQDRNSKGRARADRGTENLDALNHICRTHQRSSLSVEKCAAVDRGLKNCLLSRRAGGGERRDATLLPHSADSVAESPALTASLNQPPDMDGTLSPPDDTPGRTEEKDSTGHGHQGEAALPAEPSPRLRDTPTPSVTDKCGRVGGDGKGLHSAAATAAVVEPRSGAEPEGFPREPLMDAAVQRAGEGRADPAEPLSELQPAAARGALGGGGGTELGGPGEEPTTRPGREEGDGGSAGDRDRAESERGPLPAGEMSQPEPEELEPGEGEGEEGEEEEEEEEDEVIDGDVLECELEEEEEEEEEMGKVAGVGQDSLDDLAKRIQVEEITPAEGLVSILKRRTSLEEDTSPQPDPPKRVSKRKVRFKEPDDGLDQDEVSGDSCLILLLLCLVTVVISVGGTALYCSLADAESSVCTEFSQNVDFYLGHVRRGVEGLRHWFPPGS